MLHVLGDIGTSVGVIAYGLVIPATSWYPTDPPISLLIARGAWSILGETVGILMEATPADLDVEQLARPARSG